MWNFACDNIRTAGIVKKIQEYSRINQFSILHLFSFFFNGWIAFCDMRASSSAIPAAIILHL